MTVIDTADPLPRAVARRYRHRYAVLDVETTGLKPEAGDRIVQIAVTWLDARGVVERTWSSYVDPLRDTGVVHVHGITAEHVAGAPTFTQLAPTVASLLAGRVFVAHNARFDWAFISAEMATAGVRLPVRERLCTWKLARRLDLPVANFKMATLAAHWGIQQLRAHDAVDDTRVLVELLREELAAAQRDRVELPVERVAPPTVLERLLSRLRPAAG
ncbi:exonuclease domain-containing protein [Kineococcus aurantiacus]|uniref:DNA polymerase-3 subunit epsilon n=1 Tax=Kineococcus aurantiacus TaxID=37633 RepID=A0A7Y9DLS9_9ACTN|nr:exonuclease domain-containing protein [Kineococcus aurantiacus]NYD22859.1 DNA polymerase-3 subunit epsilon [Kineococcus aurantiacus]